MKQRKFFGTTGTAGAVKTTDADVAKNYFTSTSGYDTDITGQDPVDIGWANTMVLSVSHYNGVNRFYVNGLFVSEVADTGTNTGLIDRAGIFVSSYTSNPNIKIISLSAQELIPSFAGEQ
jgi:hypothetical protein